MTAASCSGQSAGLSVRSLVNLGIPLDLGLSWFLNLRYDVLAAESGVDLEV